MIHTIHSVPTQVPALALALLLVVCRLDEVAYIEFPSFEPMAHVIALIQDAERLGVMFDLLDPDLWEPIEGGTRIHGMFRETINGEEIAYGIGSH